jgi:hypothetical protein
MGLIACPVRGCTGTVGGYSAKCQMKSAAEREPAIDMVRGVGWSMSQCIAAA